VTNKVRAEVANVKNEDAGPERAPVSLATCALSIVKGSTSRTKLEENRTAAFSAGGSALPDFLLRRWTNNTAETLSNTAAASATAISAHFTCLLCREFLAAVSGVSSVLADERVSSSTVPRHVEGGVGSSGRGDADVTFAGLAASELLVVGTLDGAEASERSCMIRAGAECVATPLPPSHPYEVHERVDAT
jgi:hypothetical protein